MYPVTVETRMAEVVNLRTARKRAKRQQSDLVAHGKRIAHGQAKSERKLVDARKLQATRRLEQHRIDTGDGR
jgi:hypothetical protein